MAEANSDGSCGDWSSGIYYITKRLHSFLGLLGIDSLNLYILQKTALLGTATILRKVMQLSGCG